MRGYEGKKKENEILKMQQWEGGSKGPPIIERKKCVIEKETESETQ